MPEESVLGRQATALRPALRILNGSRPARARAAAPTPRRPPHAIHRRDAGTVAHAALEHACGAGMSLAVRRSATAGGLPDASFAGRHDSVLDAAFQTSLVPGDGVGRWRWAFIVAERMCAQPMAPMRRERVAAPQVRAVLAEGKRAPKAMAGHGLVRSVDGLDVHVRCGIPNNVIQIDAFAMLFNGFSIGSNDLTQLTPQRRGCDSGLVAFDFDERDPGVQALIEQAIVGAGRNGRHVGICGQAPSDNPALAAMLLAWGIDATGVTPGALPRCLRAVLAAEAAEAGQPPQR